MLPNVYTVYETIAYDLRFLEIGGGEYDDTESPLLLLSKYDEFEQPQL
jgi:hypothetical protein